MCRKGSGGWGGGGVGLGIRRPSSSCWLLLPLLGLGLGYPKCDLTIHSVRVAKEPSTRVPLLSRLFPSGALDASRRLVSSFASAHPHLQPYTYSPFHIFFEQYLTLGGEALTLLGAAGAGIFLVCLGATGSPGAATLILAMLCMLLVDMAGVMVAWGIQFNAGRWGVCVCVCQISMNRLPLSR